MQTIVDLLQGGADQATAIASVEGAPPLRYRDLRALAQKTIRDLNSLGIGRGHRVAIVLPNGPEAAAAFVCIAAGATAAPLSPGLSAEEFEFNLSDLGAKALVVAAGVDSDARSVAARLHVPVLELVPEPAQGAGSFSLRPLARNGAGPFAGGPAQPDDVALVLHTSGSTARPKIVPLLPGARKPGSVGIPAGPQIAVMDDQGRILPSGHVGEVVIRGPNVTPGYEANPEANESAFFDGWFRTGDQGLIDEDGYLRLTGRLKELINRGGEKIAPVEIDVVLMDHPAVQHCVTFAMPHEKLGEEVAAAVVLREGISCTERQLREFVARRLA